ncbi:MAG TPA: alpha/beta hydrolase [Pirellulales bacterium]|nr:alpha/beta hydrolase [Pirellulales bacterium]
MAGEPEHPAAGHAHVQSPHPGVSRPAVGRARRALRRGLVFTTALVAAVYLAIVVFMMFAEESLVFFPARQPLAGWDVPGIEHVRFQSADGTALHGWYFSHPDPRAVVLFACGNAGNISYRGDRLAQFCRRQRVALMAFDYRGYGLSEGKPTESGVLMDARAARRSLAERSGVKETDIVLIGESLGGGVMVDLASRDGARGLILERTFTSLPDVGAAHFPFIPVRWLMRNRLDSLSKIADFRGPLVICHGAVDEVIPYQLGRRLFEAANEPKRFVTLPGVGHNDPLPPEWDDAVDDFLASIQNPESRAQESEL